MKNGEADLSVLGGDQLWVCFQTCFHRSSNRAIHVTRTGEEPFIRIVPRITIFVDGEVPLVHHTRIGQPADRTCPAIVEAVEIQVAPAVARKIVIVRVFEGGAVEIGDNLIHLSFDLFLNSFLAHAKTFYARQMSEPNVSEEIIRDLRDRVEDSLTSSSTVLMNVIDALSIGPRLSTPFDVVMSPVFGYHWSSIYRGIDRAAPTTSVDGLRRARHEWLSEWSEELKQDQAKVRGWRRRVVDATNYDRPKTETVRLGYVHACAGMRVGHGLSMVSQRVGEGSWHVPLEVAVIPVGEAPAEFGARQVVDYVTRHGWGPDDLLTVDAQYTNMPTLKPLREQRVNVLGRVSSKRKFYLPPPPYAGRGRPCVRGKKIKLCDARTMPEPDERQRVEGADGEYFEVSQWADVRMYNWPEQSLGLYRVVEYRGDGRQRYKRPLWLIYIGASAAPRLADVSTLYGERFGIEHSIKFQKGEIGLTAGQFNGPGAEERVQLWVEMVATVMWLLFAARSLVRREDVAWPSWWKKGKLTPGTMRKLCGGVLLKLGVAAPHPQVRGKSRGRDVGQKLEARKRYRVYRKRKSRTMSKKAA